MAKKCVLNDKKMCDDCGECDFCDLNPFKICDNCGKCIGLDKEYREIKIDDVIVGGKSHTHSQLSKQSSHKCTCGHYHTHPTEHNDGDCDCGLKCNHEHK